MKDEFVARVGVWGQRHYNYLKKKSPTVINVMRLKGTLEQYLTDLNRVFTQVCSGRSLQIHLSGQRNKNDS